MLSRVIAKNVGDVFETQCRLRDMRDCNFDSTVENSLSRQGGYVCLSVINFT